jgi:2-keto-3-deoxy-L-rhamnonate aldolase RhmA
MKNLLKERLMNGKAAVGTFIQIGHPDVAEILSKFEFDWLLLDGEHGPLGIETMQVMLQAMNGSSVVPIIRVPGNDAMIIKRALDIGAYGIMVPLISSKKEAEEVVRAMRYQPVGIRGTGPRRASNYYLDKEYLHVADKELLSIIQIETKEAIANFRDIVRVEGIDVYFLGPMDISAALGHIGEVNHPEVEKVIRELLVLGKEAKKIGGVYAFNAKDAQKRIEQGYQFVSLGSDTRFLMGGVQESLKEVRQSVKP